MSEGYHIWSDLFVFLCRECEKDFDGDGVQDSEDVSLDFLQYTLSQDFPALNVSVEKFCEVFFYFGVYPCLHTRIGLMRLIQSLVVWYIRSVLRTRKSRKLASILFWFFYQICPENKKIWKASFKGLETMDLCAKENITTCKMKMMKMKTVIILSYRHTSKHEGKHMS